jgi:restriction system protein
MKEFDFILEPEPFFIGRQTELMWLDSRLRHRHSFESILITGSTGTGKTSLVKHWLSTRKGYGFPLWMDNSEVFGTNRKFIDFVDRVKIENKRHYDKNGLIVIIDGTDMWSEKEHELATNAIFNYKGVYSLIFIRRSPVKQRRTERLHLESLTDDVIAQILGRLLAGNLNDAQIRQVITSSKDSNFTNPLYELRNNILVPQKDIVSLVSPIIVSANNSLVSVLKKQPDNIRSLSPREFEILLADLLQDMGWEVELTQQTRDGGSDILAYMNTEIGKLLCLVEAKHYREDRKIGVDLVRNLYGTFCDAQANSAMLVTSSSFTRGAKEFQQRHEYQLSLRDYADIVGWIVKYGSNK